ncbi:N-acetylneuraminate synthase [Thalassotalea crassostreae]|uniref:N-acetylneuraminate synthase n=1 Tax=Thalassotalea crassostreae TaxID=1763536 RepID=UPI000838E393|nr:N-acetylneuraminate synthase [Thalassotalea crassostreae]
MTLIIAEAGVNHNGKEKLAFELVDVAHRAGANIVKFQTFKASKLVTASAKQADYQVTNTKKEESQLAMLERLELSYDAHHRLIDYCNKLGIEFLSTAFDSDSLKFLVEDLKLTRLKVPSGDLTNAPLVLEHALTGCDLIVSSGMANLAELESALGVIAFGYINDANKQPSIENFQAAYFSEEGKRLLKEKVTILHCTTEYPAPLEDINLNAMDTMRNAFHLDTGYSDHSAGIIVPIAAVAKGATVIEKHFTLDKNMEGPDHKASLDPVELNSMIKAIRDVEMVLGDGIKGPRPSEIKNKAVARKSLIAAKDIKIGDVIKQDDIAIKRPGNGLSPYLFWDLVDKKSTRNYNEGETFKFD